MQSEHQHIRLWDYRLVNEHLNFWGGYQVLDAATKRFVDAPETDQKIIRDYPFWIDKGPIIDGTRLTLTTSRLTYHLNESIHVAHIVEETQAGRTLFTVGPKEVTDEFVNETLVTKSAVSSATYPWRPSIYDGEAEPSPGIDYNFEITRYQFPRPDVYVIQWRPGRYYSNVLQITVE